MFPFLKNSNSSGSSRRMGITVPFHSHSHFCLSLLFVCGNDADNLITIICCVCSGCSIVKLIRRLIMQLLVSIFLFHRSKASFFSGFYDLAYRLSNKYGCSKKIHVAGEDEFPCPIGITAEEALALLRDNYSCTGGRIIIS